MGKKKTKIKVPRFKPYVYVGITYGGGWDLDRDLDAYFLNIAEKYNGEESGSGSGGGGRDLGFIFSKKTGLDDAARFVRYLRKNKKASRLISTNEIYTSVELEEY